MRQTNATFPPISTTSTPLPLPHSSTYSHLSSSSTSESFCLSSSYTDSDSQARHSAQPTSLSDKPAKSLLSGIGRQIDFAMKPDKTIYSFAWSNSSFESTDNFQPSNAPNAPTRNNNYVTSTSSPIAARANPKLDIDPRTIPPTLPRPTFWTSVTHPEMFKAYIDAKGLLPHGPNPVSISTGDQVDQAPLPEPLWKTYANTSTITAANTNRMEIISDSDSISWINDFFADHKLPTPFQPSLLLSDSKLWSSAHIDIPGISTFTDFPDLSDEIKAQKWLNHLGNALGVLHGLVPSTPSAPAARYHQYTQYPWSAEGRCHSQMWRPFL